MVPSRQGSHYRLSSADMNHLEKTDKPTAREDTSKPSSSPDEANDTLAPLATKQANFASFCSDFSRLESDPFYSPPVLGEPVTTSAHSQQSIIEAADSDKAKSNNSGLVQMVEHQISPYKIECPDLLCYDIAYRPSPDDTNSLRTVSVMNLPHDITMAELMKKIRGGRVIVARLLNTVSLSRNYSATVTFFSQTAAVAFVAFAATHPIFFRQNRAYVTLLRSPTWPVSIAIRAAIHQHKLTRCLKIDNFPRNIGPNKLCRDLRFHKDIHSYAIESMKLFENNHLKIRFSSIYAAQKAFEFFVHSREYRSGRVKWDLDPCTLPLQQVLRNDIGEGVTPECKGLGEQTVTATPEGMRQGEQEDQFLERHSKHSSSTRVTAEPALALDVPQFSLGNRREDFSKEKVVNPDD